MTGAGENIHQRRRKGPSKGVRATISSPRYILIDGRVTRRRPAAVAASAVRRRRRRAARVVRGRVAVRAVRIPSVRVRRSVAARRHRAATFESRRTAAEKRRWIRGQISRKVALQREQQARENRDSSNTPSRGATAVTFVARRVRLVTCAGAAFVARVVRSAHRVQRRRASIRVHGTISSSRQRGRHATSRSIVRRGHDRRARGAGRGRVALRAVRVSHAGGGSDRHRRSVRRTIVRRGRRRRVAWHSGGRVRRVVRVVRGAVDWSAVRSRRGRSAAVVDARRSSVAFVTRRRTVAALDRRRAVIVAATAVRGSVAWRRSTAVPIRTSSGASATSTARSVRPGTSQLRVRDV